MSSNVRSQTSMDEIRTSIETLSKAAIVPADQVIALMQKIVSSTNEHVQNLKNAIHSKLQSKTNLITWTKSTSAPSKISNPKAVVECIKTTLDALQKSARTATSATTPRTQARAAAPVRAATSFDFNVCRNLAQSHREFIRDTAEATYQAIRNNADNRNEALHVLYNNLLKIALAALLDRATVGSATLKAKLFDFAQDTLQLRPENLHSASELFNTVSDSINAIATENVQREETVTREMHQIQDEMMYKTLQELVSNNTPPQKIVDTLTNQFGMSHVEAEEAHTNITASLREPTPQRARQENRNEDAMQAEILQVQRELGCDYDTAFEAVAAKHAAEGQAEAELAQPAAHAADNEVEQVIAAQLANPQAVRVIPLVLEQIHGAWLDATRAASKDLISKKTYTADEFGQGSAADFAALNLALLNMAKNAKKSGSNLVITYNQFQKSGKTYSSSKATLTLSKSNDSHDVFTRLAKIKEKLDTLNDTLREKLEELITLKRKPNADENSLVNELFKLITHLRIGAPKQQKSLEQDVLILEIPNRPTIGSVLQNISAWMNIKT